MNLITYEPASVTPHDFIAYWSDVYPAHDDIVLYTPNIGNRSPEALQRLFLWKFGKRFAEATRKKVEAQVIFRLAELNAIPENCIAGDFLQRFSAGGAIFRIFLLHCWNPSRFPIYDQHVHRAMSMAKSGQCEEIETWSDKEKIAAYLEDYLPFHSAFVAFDQRLIDRALWAYGKFIKFSRLPGGCSSVRKVSAT